MSYTQHIKRLAAPQGGEMSETPKFTAGPWHPGHLGSDSTCQCASVVSEGYAGGICSVTIGNGLPIGEGGNDGPPREEAIGNMRLIAAAPDLYAALVELDARLFACGALHTAEDAYDSQLQALVSEALSKASGAEKP